jgi:hypothetical protein
MGGRGEIQMRIVPIEDIARDMGRENLRVLTVPDAVVRYSGCFRTSLHGRPTDLAIRQITLSADGTLHLDIVIRDEHGTAFLSTSRGRRSVLTSTVHLTTEDLQQHATDDRQPTTDKIQ